MQLILFPAHRPPMFGGLIGLFACCLQNHKKGGDLQRKACSSYPG